MRKNDPRKSSESTLNLRPQMVLGSFWMLAVNICRRGIGIVSTIILARLLAPSDFGLVAMASVLLVMVQALTEFGFDVALIQKQEATRVHYDTAWTFKVIFGVASALLMAALAWPAAIFYSEPRIFPIVIALSFGVFMRGFENIGIVDFRKEFEYHKEFQFFTTIKLTAFLVTLAFALAYRSFWALVIGTLTSRVTGLLLSYTLHSYRPRFSIAARKELFSFSMWLFLNNLLFFVRTRGADFIVGKLLGARSLGLFSIGSEIASLPTTELIAPINRAIFPGYSKIAHDPARFREAFLNVIGVIGLVAIPSAAGIAVVANLAIPFLLGPNWVEAVPLVQLLAFVGLLTSLHSNTGAAYIALGKPRIHVVLQTLSAMILIPCAIVFANRFGIVGVAYAYLLANGTTFLINFFVAVRLLHLKPSKLVGAVIRPAFSAVLMYISVAQLQPYLVDQLPAGVSLLASVLIGGLVFTAATILTWLATGKVKGPELVIIGYARNVPILRRIAERLMPSKT